MLTAKGMKQIVECRPALSPLPHDSPCRTGAWLADAAVVAEHEPLQVKLVVSSSPVAAERMRLER